MKRNKNSGLGSESSHYVITAKKSRVQNRSEAQPISIEENFESSSSQGQDTNLSAQALEPPVNLNSNPDVTEVSESGKELDTNKTSGKSGIAKIQTSLDKCGFSVIQSSSGSKLSTSRNQVASPANTRVAVASNKITQTRPIKIDDSKITSVRDSSGSLVFVTQVEGFTFPVTKDLQNLFSYQGHKIEKIENCVGQYNITKNFVVKCSLCEKPLTDPSKKKQQPNKWWMTKNSNHNSEEHMQKQHPVEFKTVLEQREALKNSKTFSNSVSRLFFSRRADVYVTKYLKSEPKQQLFEMNVVNCVATDSRPFSLVNGEGFQKMIYDLDSQISIPHSTTIRAKTFAMAENHALPELKHWLEDCTFGNVVVDNWSSKRQDGIMGIRFQKINSNFELEIRTLACVELNGPHTGKLCYEKYKEVVSKFGLENKVSHVMSDRGSNMVSAFTNPMVRCPGTELDEYIPLKEFERILNDMDDQPLRLNEVKQNTITEENEVAVLNDVLSKPGQLAVTAMPFFHISSCIA